MSLLGLDTVVYRTLLQSLGDADVCRLLLVNREVNVKVREHTNSSMYWNEKLSNLLLFDVSDKTTYAKDIYMDLVVTNMYKACVIDYLTDDDPWCVTELFEKACWNGASRMVKMILDNPEFVIRGADPLKHAAGSGHAKLVQLLLKHPHVDPTLEHNSAMYSACMNGQLEAVRCLIEDPRVDPSADNNRSILVALRTNQVKIVKLLMSHPKVDPCFNNSVILRHACSRVQMKMIKMFLAHPSVPSQEMLPREPLLFACERGLMAVVRALIEDPRIEITDSAIDKADLFKKHKIATLLRERK